MPACRSRHASGQPDSQLSVYGGPAEDLWTLGSARAFCVSKLGRRDGRDAGLTLLVRRYGREVAAARGRWSRSTSVRPFCSRHLLLGTIRVPGGRIPAASPTEGTRVAPSSGSDPEPTGRPHVQANWRQRASVSLCAGLDLTGQALVPLVVAVSDVSPGGAVVDDPLGVAEG